MDILERLHRRGVKTHYEGCEEFHDDCAAYAEIVRLRGETVADGVVDSWSLLTPLGGVVRFNLTVKDATVSFDTERVGAIHGQRVRVVTIPAIPPEAK